MNKIYIPVDVQEKPEFETNPDFPDLSVDVHFICKDGSKQSGFYDFSLDQWRNFKGGIVEVDYWLKEVDKEEYDREIAGKAWDACINHIEEQDKYPYGTRNGVYNFPNKEQYLNTIT